MANIKLLGIDQTTGQGRFLEATDVGLNLPPSPVVASVRILANAGGTSYTQAYLQSLYDGQAGLDAPNTVPAAVTNYANTLGTSAYKVYLGANTWFYTNTATGIITTNWLVFGGNKSAFAANIFSTGIITFK